MLLDTIRQMYPHLTRSQQRISEYISHTYRDAAFMTASELASRLGLNEATVIRYAQRLGYGGYPELVAAVRELVQQELVASSEGAEDGQDTALTLFTSELESARRLEGTLFLQSTTRAAEVLAQAQRVLVLGEGVSHPYATLLCDLLFDLGIDARSGTPDLASLTRQLCELERGWAVIVIAADYGGSELLAAALKLARQRHAGTIALALDPVSPCARAADIALALPYSTDSVPPPLTATAAMLEVLARLVAPRVPEPAASRRERLIETRTELMSLVEQG